MNWPLSSTNWVPAWEGYDCPENNDVSKPGGSRIRFGSRYADPHLSKKLNSDPHIMNVNPKHRNSPLTSFYFFFRAVFP
jgi:hypothetical protein